LALRVAHVFDARSQQAHRTQAALLVHAPPMATGSIHVFAPGRSAQGSKAHGRDPTTERQAHQDRDWTTAALFSPPNFRVAA
jgi:hypothetical protein